MRKYLLDNGPLVALVKGRPGAERLMRPWVEHDEATTSILVYGEALEYFKTSPDYFRHRRNLRALLQGVTAYRLSYPILERYADLLLALRPGGRLIGDIDTLIAATALEHGLTVIALDSDYTRVPGLSVMHLSRSDLMS
ncbi:MAG TPA: type II toxin-antitoxin system VapC family toxin [Ktedonobacterales bacterium]|nr:type II toxin-antitoxin system VapC family toxin [Ktedonobacterales bacterium]